MKESQEVKFLRFFVFNKTLTTPKHFQNKQAVLSHHQVRQIGEIDMADYVMNKNESFQFTYSAKQQEEVERIRSKYLPKEESKMEKLIKLDKKAEQPGQIVSIATGVIGALLLGVGMTCTMVWNTSIVVFVAGILIGLVGMAVAGIAYPLYINITKKERAKIADQIIALTNELSLEN